MTITEFLLARIAEDEAAANEVAADRNGNFTGLELWAAETNGWVAVGASAERMLAECAAKRAIIGRQRDLWEMAMGVTVNDAEDEANDGLSFAIRALAAVYADQPDYQQEWAL